jgi:hypothetical protein
MLISLPPLAQNGSSNSSALQLYNHGKRRRIGEMDLLLGYSFLLFLLLSQPRLYDISNTYLED